jgi:hypothetical protein
MQAAPRPENCGAASFFPVGPLSVAGANFYVRPFLFSKGCRVYFRLCYKLGCTLLSGRETASVRRKSFLNPEYLSSSQLPAPAYSKIREGTERNLVAKNPDLVLQNATGRLCFCVTPICQMSVSIVCSAAHPMVGTKSGNKYANTYSTCSRLLF